MPLHFLPANIVVGDSETPTPQLTVINWKWVRRGSGIFDVGLFAGEVWLAEFFHSWRDLVDCFSSRIWKKLTCQLNVGSKLRGDLL